VTSLLLAMPGWCTDTETSGSGDTERRLLSRFRPAVIVNLGLKQEQHIIKLEPVLWIRDILVRIRIRGSVPRTSGSGSGSCLFRQWQLAYHFLKVLSSVFKDKK
jgi:hypothetical protein